MSFGIRNFTVLCVLLGLTAFGCRKERTEVPLELSKDKVTPSPQKNNDILGSNGVVEASQNPNEPEVQGSTTPIDEQQKEPYPIQSNISAKESPVLTTSQKLDLSVNTSFDSNSLKISKDEFFSAVIWDRPTVVSSYLSHGGDVDAVNSDGNTALIEFFIANHYIRDCSIEACKEILELLIEAGTDVNRKASGKRLTHLKDHTPLMIIAKKGPVYEFNAEITVLAIQNLIDAGANTEARTNEGFTPLMLISQESDIGNSSIDIAKVLLKNKADPGARDNNGWTALMHATYFLGGDIFYSINRNYMSQLTEALLRNGADPNAQSNEGVTPLMLASYSGEIATVQTLIAYGADPNAETNEGKTSPMICAGFAYRRTRPRVIRRILLDAGASPFRKSAMFGQTEDEWLSNFGLSEFNLDYIAHRNWLETGGIANDESCTLRPL